MAKFELTTKAVEDLSKIWNYTYEVWSENQADRYYSNLINDCQSLADNHDLGKQYIEIELYLLGFKSGQHIIFYKVLTTEKIQIIRILHSRMDLKRRIQE